MFKSSKSKDKDNDKGKDKGKGKSNRKGEGSEDDNRSERSSRATSEVDAEQDYSPEFEGTCNSPEDNNNNAVDRGIAFGKTWGSHQSSSDRDREVTQPWVRDGTATTTGSGVATIKRDAVALPPRVDVKTEVGHHRGVHAVEPSNSRLLVVEGDEETMTLNPTVGHEFPSGSPPDSADTNNNRMFPTRRLARVNDDRDVAMVIKDGSEGIKTEKPGSRDVTDMRKTVPNTSNVNTTLAAAPGSGSGSESGSGLSTPRNMNGYDNSNTAVRVKSVRSSTDLFSVHQDLDNGHVEDNNNEVCMYIDYYY